MENYFVAYMYTTPDGGWGTGNCFISCSVPFNTEEAVREAERSIRDKNKFTGCAITNFIKVG